jgi:hypothetical protein
MIKMENINIGIANLVIANKLKNAYLENNLITESRKHVSDFFELVKKSPILQLEFKIFNKIENKYIDNDTIATRYIDNNIKLFEVYTLGEIEDEHKKLKSFIGLNENLQSFDEVKVKLYNSIFVLIKESLNDYSKIDVDAIHESFSYVLNYIKEPKTKEISDIINNKSEVNDEIIEIAIEKFNERYNSLNEEEKDLLEKLTKSNREEKKTLLEDYKQENLTILENLNKDEIKDNITQAISKINNMKYNHETIVDDIISLYELKKNLL